MQSFEEAGRSYVRDIVLTLEKYKPYAIQMDEGLDKAVEGVESLPKEVLVGGYHELKTFYEANPEGTPNLGSLMKYMAENNSEKYIEIGSQLAVIIAYLSHTCYWGKPYAWVKHQVLLGTNFELSKGENFSNEKFH